MKLVLDTGVIIAFAAEESDKSLDSIETIFNMTRAKKLNTFISVITISELVAFFNKIKDPKKAVEILTFLDEIGTNIINMEKEIAKNSGILKSRYSISFADAIILATCTSIGACLVTYDKEFSMIKDTQIFKPEEFIRTL